jgi:hypothetical protein
MNRDLTNYGQSAYFWTFFENIRILVVLALCRYPKLLLFFILTMKKKKLLDFGGLPKQCAYHASIIQNLNVVTLELDMKVQFGNF